METADIFIDPFTDYGFKRLFCREANVDLLIDFLNTVLHPEQLIVSLIYLNTEQTGQVKMDRKTVFDIYCRDEAGDMFVIELQRIKQTYFKDRSLFYATTPIQNQGRRGEWNFKLSPVRVVCLMNFVFDDSDPAEMIHRVNLINSKNGKIFNDTLSFIYIEMPKFKKELTEINNRLDEWFFVLNRLCNLPEIPVPLESDPIFKKLFMEAEISHYSIDEAHADMASKKEEWDRYAIEETAREDGKKEGELKGKQEGIIEGELKGKQESKLEIALQMKLANEPIDKIARYTGLTTAQIEELTR